MGVKTNFSYLGGNGKIPGPGTYLSTSDLLGDKSKGYSFGGKKQFSHTGKQFPGPGAYEMKSTIPVNERGNSFGRERRAKKDLRNNPGPGQYAIATTYTKSAAPKFGFGTQLKGTNMASRNNTPGPGQYEQKVHGRTAPRGLVLPRRPESAPAKGRGTPGPGQYEDVNCHKRAAPKYRMGTAVARGKPNKDVVKNPAPNSYDPSRNPTLLKNPTWKMGTDKRRPLSARNQNPGPGNYTISSGKSGPAFGLRGRNVILNGDKTPGPGQYQPRPENVRPTSARCKFGSENRRGPKGVKNVPGPGQYNYSKEKLAKASPAYGFGTGKRSKKNNQGSPGPGSYHIPCKVVEVPRYLQTKQPEEFRFI